QRVLHLHGLDHRDTLSRLDALACAHEKLKDFAVHRRLDVAVAGAGLGGRLRYVLEPHARLAAVPQYVGLVCGREHPGVTGRLGAIDRDVHAAIAVVHGGLPALTVDDDRHRHPADPGELKAVARGPGRVWLRPAFRD